MKNRQIILIAILLFLVYVAYRMKNTITVYESDYPDEPSTTGQEPTLPVATSRQILNRQLPQAKVSGCKKPSFDKSVQYSGRECAGTLISETEVLKLGDQGCSVLLLQQRLNNIETQVNILKPNGKFCCQTQSKLMRVMGVDKIALNQFSPDEQIGFNSLEAGTRVTPHSYMDANLYKR